MPTYEFIAENPSKSCSFCRQAFEVARRLSEAPLTRCPRCNSPVRKLLSAPAIGRSKSGLDDRAKAAGFKKLKTIGAGEYEQQY